MAVSGVSVFWCAIESKIGATVYISTYSGHLSHLKGENDGKLELLKNAFGSFGGSFEASDGFRHSYCCCAIGDPWS